ncbi:hypothetical protein FB45DRAFT_1040098 [Roridomyces roridus]|uniref:MYND-type domain-containing protein n=1 Tax=Roridomyces roridus TaxID=1738132 RepID=A0AAD7B1G9_9AGAR|nr:hypothetical protein FB45DRAFT_1040098 [Roridomyces roridus]
MGRRTRARSSESDGQIEVWVSVGYGASPKMPAFTGTESARRDWNAAWEDDISTLFGSDIEISHTGFYPPSFIDPTKREAPFDILLDSETSATKMQNNFSVEFTQRCAWDDFEGNWMDKSPQEREEAILEGLWRTCDSEFLESGKKWCPELTLERLNRDSGQGFLDLLRQLCLQDLPRIPTDFKTVPNAVYEKVTAVKGEPPHPGAVLLKRYGDLERSFCLTAISFEIMRVFCGSALEWIKVKRRRDNQADLDRAKELLYGRVDVETLFGETPRKDPKSVYVCSSCGLSAEAAGYAKLSVCGPCRQINRFVYYCSKNWKHGTPPHKHICGKKKCALAEALLAALQSEPAAAQDESANDGFFGPPEPGYTRSPALL